MKTNRFPLFLATILLALAAGLRAAPPVANRDAAIPNALEPWKAWVLWDDDHRNCPTPFSDPAKHFCFWPSRLGLQVDNAGARFDLGVTVFHETWVPLPGGAEAWPLAVTANGAAIPVVEHDGKPAVKLATGTFTLAGSYRWSAIPARLPVPREIGILALTLDGKPVESPAWDAEGFLWLKRAGSSDEAEKELLEIKVHALLEDGIPMWWRTEIELIVSGKSREEDLGTILPEGWKLSAVQSQIPVAVDDSGRMKAQVRAGKWTIHTDAFRFDNPKEFRYLEGAKIAAAEQFVAFRSKPDFRISEVVGPPSVDISQTTFPEQWRELPVYRWETATPFRFEERMRGMGEQKPAGLTIAREWWLDENGGGLTFRDAITGQMQQIWRLDAAPGEDLGSVRGGGQGQLITRNPQTGAPGVEIRTRNLDLEATGRMAREPQLTATGQSNESGGFTWMFGAHTSGLPATGWSADADALTITLNLPPGWRLFALFGADWVRGDWVTAWTLLDLFLLLIFTLAVGRLWGFGAGALAFFAFGLAYHEPGAPRFIWLLLIIALALLRAVPEGWPRRVISICRCVTIAIFVLIMVPFVARQIRQALYPQLEVVRSSRWMGQQIQNMGDGNLDSAARVSSEAEVERNEPSSYGLLSSTSIVRRQASQKDNLLYDAKARIQTGPGVPQWTWRTVSFGWNGPVLASQQVRPILISSGVERLLTVLRVALLLALAAVLLGAQRLGGTLFRRRTAKVAVMLIVGLCAASSANAQVPNKETLDALRTRLLESSDAFPHAAEIPNVSLALKDRRIVIDAEIHVAANSAVPLPGRLPAWSPLSVLVDDKPEAALRRDDGFLWVVLAPGVHRVRVEGLLPNVTEWEWTYLLKPRQVTIEAPGWTVSGVRAGGVPEAQVFFALQQKAAAGAASYDRQDLQTIAVIDRQLELGLVWQVRTTVSRLSPAGKAVALRVPLLPGENVLSANVLAKDGFIEVRLGAQEDSFTWESGLAIGPTLKLATRAEDSWVERWRLVASPVWNVQISGLAPVFEKQEVAAVTSNITIRAAGGDLIPVWQPWPGESVELAINRPEAVAGATVTVSKATHEISLGKRQRVSKLDLALRCSLGEDFLIDLPANAEITALSQNGKTLPVRKDGARLVIPLRPGEQSVEVTWKINRMLDSRARAEAVRLPVESANLSTIVNVPDDRWVLWTDGPRRGPAVLFWVILVCSLLAALALARIAFSPLRAFGWMLLVIGLTQVPLPAALVVIGWLFLLSWRGSEPFAKLDANRHNFLQVVLIVLTVAALVILIFAVGEGLLGHPEMFILGNGSSRTVLRWFQARADGPLPTPGCLSVSIWWYRFLMLLWALWLAAAVIRWLRMGWQNFSAGGFFRHEVKPQPVTVPPPLPKPV